MTKTQDNRMNEGTADGTRRDRSERRLTPHGALPQCQQRGRRRGTALILVIALLGILFVVGVTFLKTMDFEAQVIDHERQQDQSQGVVNVVTTAVGRVLLESFVDKDRVPYRANQSDALVAPNTGYLKLTFPSYGLSMGVHGVVGSAEPDFYCTDPLAVDCPPDQKQQGYGFTLPPFWGALFKREGVDGQPYAFESRFDPINAVGTEYDRYTFARPVDTDPRIVRIDTDPPQDVPGFLADPMSKRVSYGAPVDANGDGIFDAREFDLSWLGLSEGQLGPIRATVNDPLNLRGGAHLSLQVVDHSALVNVNYGHQTLVDTVLADVFDDEGRPEDPLRFRNWKPREFENGQAKQDTGYVAPLEEPILRHRGLIAPREITPSMLHGNPGDPEVVKKNLDNPGMGDLGLHLLPPVDPEQHEAAPWWQWWPMEHDEEWPDNGDWTLWRVRMTRSDQTTKEQYDRRHLLTTVGYDDLLMRGGYTDGNDNKQFDVGEEWIEKMRSIYGSPPGIDKNTPFDFHLYPYPEGLNYDEPLANVDPLAGRRLLSLPWINDVLLGVEKDGVKGIDRLGSEHWLTPFSLTGRDYRAIGLIQSAFTMLLLNARGEDWVTGAPPVVDYDRISVTAASLTANLIDYADSNDDPMRVPLRESNPALNTFGQVLPGRVVYGLEHQPFITEVVAIVQEDPNNQGYPILLQSAWAVELYNPFGCDPNGGSCNPVLHNIPLNRFGLYVTAKDETTLPADPTVPSVGASWTPFTGTMLPRSFAVVVQDYGNLINPINGEIAGNDFNFEFRNGRTVFLARRDVDGTWYAVDAFVLGADIGKPKTPAAPYSMERMFKKPQGTWNLNWTFTVPVAEEYELANVNDHSLDDFNTRMDDVAIRPVEVVSPIAPDAGDLKTAFPTTGSLLLLMRHANYRNGVSGQSIPFTARLLEITAVDNGRMPVFDDFPFDPDSTPKLYRHHIDPVTGRFTPPKAGLEFLPGGTKYLPWGQLVFDYFTALPLKSPDKWTPMEITNDPNEPFNNRDVQPYVDMNGLRVHGRVNLQTAPWSVIEGIPMMPWGKFPSAVRGKLRAMADDLAPGVPSNPDDPNDPAFKFRVGPELAQAIVAYRDARQVGGVADVNAVPPEYPATGRYDLFERELRNSVPDALRRSRPGMGFLTLGELLNVRRLDADRYVEPSAKPWTSRYRMDAGVVHRQIPDTGQAPGYQVSGLLNECYAFGNPQEDYIQAVSLMVMLGDWATTRSHVYTIYGTIRGDVFDRDVNDQFSAEEIAEVNERALRFQETLDRLPVLKGSPTEPGLNQEKPVRIGQRSVGMYDDAFNK